MNNYFQKQIDKDRIVKWEQVEKRIREELYKKQSQDVENNTSDEGGGGDEQKTKEIITNSIYKESQSMSQEDSQITKIETKSAKKYNTKRQQKLNQQSLSLSKQSTDIINQNLSDNKYDEKQNYDDNSSHQNQMQAVPKKTSLRKTKQTKSEGISEFSGAIDDKLQELSENRREINNKKSNKKGLLNKQHESNDKLNIDSSNSSVVDNVFKNNTLFKDFLDPTKSKTIEEHIKKNKIKIISGIPQYPNISDSNRQNLMKQWWKQVNDNYFKEISEKDLSILKHLVPPLYNLGCEDTNQSKNPPSQAYKYQKFITKSQIYQQLIENDYYMNGNTPCLKNNSLLTILFEKNEQRYLLKYEINQNKSILEIEQDLNINCKETIEYFINQLKIISIKNINTSDQSESNQSLSNQDCQKPGNETKYSVLQSTLNDEQYIQTIGKQIQNEEQCDQNREIYIQSKKEQQISIENVQIESQEQDLENYKMSDILQLLDVQGLDKQSYINSIDCTQFILKKQNEIYQEQNHTKQKHIPDDALEYELIYLQQQLETIHKTNSNNIQRLHYDIQNEQIKYLQIDDLEKEQRKVYDIVKWNTIIRYMQVGYGEKNQDILLTYIKSDSDQSNENTENNKNIIQAAEMNTQSSSAGKNDPNKKKILMGILRQIVKYVLIITAVNPTLLFTVQCVLLHFINIVMESKKYLKMIFFVIYAFIDKNKKKMIVILKIKLLIQLLILLPTLRVIFASSLFQFYLNSYIYYNKDQYNYEFSNILFIFKNEIFNNKIEEQKKEHRYLCKICMKAGFPMVDVNHQFYHVSCLIFLNMVYIKDSCLSLRGGESDEEIEIFQEKILEIVVKSELEKHICGICQKRQGYKIQCAHPNCILSFHTHCAYIHGLHFDLSIHSQPSQNNALSTQFKSTTHSMPPKSNLADSKDPSLFNNENSDSILNDRYYVINEKSDSFNERLDCKNQILNKQNENKKQQENKSLINKQKNISSGSSLDLDSIEESFYQISTKLYCPSHQPIKDRDEILQIYLRRYGINLYKTATQFQDYHSFTSEHQFDLKELKQNYLSTTNYTLKNKIQPFLTFNNFQKGLHFLRNFRRIQNLVLCFGQNILLILNKDKKQKKPKLKSKKNWRNVIQIVFLMIQQQIIIQKQKQRLFQQYFFKSQVETAVASQQQQQLPQTLPQDKFHNYSSDKQKSDLSYQEQQKCLKQQSQLQQQQLYPQSSSLLQQKQQSQQSYSNQFLQSSQQITQIKNTTKPFQNINNQTDQKTQNYLIDYKMTYNQISQNVQSSSSQLQLNNTQDMRQQLKPNNQFQSTIPIKPQISSSSYNKTNGNIKAIPIQQHERNQKNLNRSNLQNIQNNNNNINKNKQNTNNNSNNNNNHNINNRNLNRQNNINQSNIKQPLQYSSYTQIKNQSQNKNNYESIPNICQNLIEANKMISDIFSD